MLKRGKVREIAYRTFVSGALQGIPLSDFEPYKKSIISGMRVLRQELDVYQTAFVMLDAIEDEDESVGCETLAYFDIGMKACVIDPRRICRISKDVDTAMAILMSHEMVHGEQYKTGKLTHRLIDDEWRFVWKDAVYPSGILNDGLVYRRMPWEVEAYGRQESLARAIIRG